MLFDYYDGNLDPRTFHLLAGLALGAVFGIAAQVSRFCFRRAIVGPEAERAAAGAVWLTALTAGILGFFVLSAAGLVAIDDHRFMAAELPVAAVVIGGLLFGAGMVLTRGCISRLTVQSATGNLRAVLVLLVIAVTAHATLKGVLAPLRTSLGAVTLELPSGSLFAKPLGSAVLLFAVVAGAVLLARRGAARPRDLVLGALIGLVAVCGWAVTSTLLFDEFDPQPVQTAAFILPWTDTLFWTIASTAVPAGFGVGFVGGVLGGSFLSAAARREVSLQSFETPAQTLRYVAGGLLMGLGGTLAGGCTIGAGLSGVATGSVMSLLALVSIGFGARATGGALSPKRSLAAA
jgi:uncharacterized membrane protein YedE/YeeE